MGHDEPNALDERQRRLGINEVLFREVNEQVEALGTILGDDGGTLDIVCECGDASCTVRLVVPRAVYERTRADPARFLVAPGHEAPDVERVVERHEGFDIVQKLEGDPSRLAEETVS